MNQSITDLTPHFTSAASLAVIGMKLREVDLLAPGMITIALFRSWTST